ncbi:hypothetical protein LY76DRAFT_86691 [Colletotrichum caudatum]|nr:hypothetical protein LY76DRAFT_86691 [Colletotrichum caudatum]
MPPSSQYYVSIPTYDTCRHVMKGKERKGNRSAEKKQSSAHQPLRADNQRFATTSPNPSLSIQFRSTRASVIKAQLLDSRLGNKPRVMYVSGTMPALGQPTVVRLPALRPLLSDAPSVGRALPNSPGLDACPIGSPPWCCNKSTSAPQRRYCAVLLACRSLTCVTDSGEGV